MLRSAVTITTSLILLNLAPACRAADVVWPGWLGPERNGWVSVFEPPEEWPEMLTKVWQADVGTGYGSPLVSDGRVYQHARQVEDEVVWCFDLATGKVLWRKSYPAPFTIGGGGEFHGKGPKSSPALSDGRLFTMSITGVLTAWDADSGARLWQSNYGSRFKSSQPYWGVSTSPIVDGDHIIAHFGTDDEGALTALDVQTGQEAWSLAGDGASYSSPLLAEIDGVKQVVEWNHRALVGVDRSTGRRLWEYPFPHEGSNQNMPTPALDDGRVLLSGENRGFHSLQPQLRDGSWTVTKNWNNNDVALDMSSAVMNGGLLYGFSHYGSGRLFCLDPKSGEVLWQSPGRVGSNVMFLSIPGHVVALVDNGELQVIRATGERFQNVATYRVSETPTWAPPVLLPTQVLVKDLQTLTLWSLTPDGAAANAP
ncbi:MAG: PQQ-binding-like beta-propeller repeat protein [Planctomycetaceae bacterium]